MAAQSFHETKNFSCGEGGAIVINDAAATWTEPRSFARRAPTGATSSAASSTSTRGWIIGSSYLPSDLLAAMLLAQLEDREWVWEHRSTVWNRYAEGLADWSQVNSVHCRLSRSTVRRPTIFSI